MKPSQNSRPASVTANAGAPILAKKKPWIAPMAAPLARATSTASHSFMPWVTLSTAVMAPATPLTEPTDRSISPSSSTKMMPTDIMPVATIATAMLLRFSAREEGRVEALEDDADDDQADDDRDGAQVTGPHLALELVEVAGEASLAHQQPGVDGDIGARGGLGVLDDVVVGSGGGLVDAHF